MNKRLLSLLIVGQMMLSLPMTAHTASFEYSVDSEFSKVAVAVVNHNTLKVSGASGQVLQIYNLTGVCVVSYKIDGDSILYDLNLPKGCYIIKVGTLVRKVSLS